MICKNCGKENDVNMKFCGECGSRLTDILEEDVIEYLQQMCEKLSKYYEFDEVGDNSSSIVEKNLKEVSEKIDKINSEIVNHRSTIDALYIDKVKGLVDEDMYKRIYEKTRNIILNLEMDLNDLNKKKRLNEEQTKTTVTSSFHRCKKAVLDYMSLKNPDRDLITRLIERIEIDKDKNIYVVFRFKEFQVVE